MRIQFPLFGIKIEILIEYVRINSSLKHILHRLNFGDSSIHDLFQILIGSRKNDHFHFSVVLVTLIGPSQHSFSNAHIKLYDTLRFNSFNNFLRIT